jgi:multidrug resistance protein MdtO
LAASSCYVLYNALAWPGISPAVTTCLLTALSTIGASRQKQILRIASAIMGGFVMGMGAQVFILPYVDSIAGFVVLFSVVTAVSSWFMTSSPRLSYFGVQMALAFYLVHLQEFTIQTSLSVARDRVVGILLGLIMMGLVFDQVWGVRAGLEMKRTFILNLRLVAEFARGPASNNLRIAIGRGPALRETINANLDKVRALADGVLFEFGPSRRSDLELRSYIHQWQPQLTTLFVMRIAFLKYRLQLPGFELPESVRLRQQAYDEHSARMLEEIAALIEQRTPPERKSIKASRQLLESTVEAIQGEPAHLPAGRVQSFLTLLRGIDELTTRLTSAITRDAASSPCITA